MAEKFSGYIQPNILPLNNDAIFAHEFEPVMVEDPANFMDLYTKLDDRSLQGRLIAELIARAAEKIEYIAPGKLWLPSKVECLEVGKGDIELDEPGVTLVSLEKSYGSFTKKQVGFVQRLLPHTLGFVLNTHETPHTRLKPYSDRPIKSQKLLTITGRLATK